MEPLAGSGSSGRDAFFVDANRQTHHSRISLGVLDPAGQHHDPRARCGTGGGCAAPGCIINTADATVAASPPGRIGCSRARGCQEAGGAEACIAGAAAHDRASPACAAARSANARSASSRSLK